MVLVAVSDDSSMRSRRVAQGIIAVGVVAVVGAIAPWHWAVWRPIGATLVAHGSMVFGAAGLVGVVVGLILLRRARPPATPTVPTVNPGSSWWLSDRAIVAVTVGIGLVGVAILFVLLAVAQSAPTGERPSLRIEGIKYGLGVVASGGVLAALLLAVRRQHLAEKVQAHNEADTVERHVTEIYTKAVEQLGSADATVRLGGLYALERLAQSNVGQRQTIVNVICASLCMPYDPPRAAAARPSTRQHGGLLPGRSRRPSPPTETAPRDARQELQVRLTAQRILTTHLIATGDPYDDHGAYPELVDHGTTSPAATEPPLVFWPAIDLNLTGATLIDWRLSDCHLRRATFAGATFIGDAWFPRTKFTDDARFDRATFTGDAWFFDANFAGKAPFHGATFARDASFTQASFGGAARFKDATFAGNASFHHVTFTGAAWLRDATFARGVDLETARVVMQNGQRRWRDRWPPGWRRVPDPADPSVGRLVKDSADEGLIADEPDGG